MKLWMLVTAVAVFMVVAIAAPSIPLLAEDDDGGKHKDRAGHITKVLGQVKVSLADACVSAEKSTGGRAVRAQLEADGDELTYEVVTVTVTGEKVVFHEVDLDARTGKVIETEVMNPKRRHHDEDDGDEDGDEDDDDDDDDDDDEDDEEDDDDDDDDDDEDDD